MTDKEKLDLAQWAIKCTMKAGADQTAVSIFSGREVEVEYRDRKIERLKESTESSLNLQIYAASRYSSHSTNDLRKNNLTGFIKQAVAATKYLAEDKYRSLPDPKYYPKESAVDLKIYDGSIDQIQPSERKKTAAEIESAAMAQSDQIISTTAFYADNRYETVKMHSNGFLGKTRSTSFFAGAMVTVKDNDKRPEDGFFVNTCFYKDLPAIDSICKNAAHRALRRIGQKKDNSGHYDMIVENLMAGQLISMLTQPMTGYALQQKQSFLDGMLGKKIASEKLTIIDDPFIEKGLGSQFFDYEGLAAKKMVMVEKGLLRNYYIDNYYGKKLGMEPTSGSTSNLVFECGSKSLDELIKGLKKGILVTRFIGGNSNSTTGDFSFGIFGLLIENGQIVQPVSEMNISGNAKEFWNQLVEVGNDPYDYQSWRTPSMLFESVSFSGV